MVLRQSVFLLCFFRNGMTHTKKNLPCKPYLGETGTHQQQNAWLLDIRAYQAMAMAVSLCEFKTKTGHWLYVQQNILNTLKY